VKAGVSIEMERAMDDDNAGNAGWVAALRMSGDADPGERA